MAGQYVIPEVSGLAACVAWAEGGVVDARVVIGTRGTHRPEVGTSVPTLPNSTTGKNLELTKPKKESPAPSTPTTLSAAEFYVVDILHCVTCIRIVRENGLCPPQAWRLLCPSSWALCLTWQNRKTTQACPSQARLGVALSLAVPWRMERNYEREAGQSRVVPQSHFTLGESLESLAPCTSSTSTNGEVLAQQPASTSCSPLCVQCQAS